MVAMSVPTPTLTPQQVIEATNQARLAAGLAPLTVNAELATAAEDKSLDMETRQYFAHQSPQGFDPWYWIKKHNYAFSFAGENLAINFSDSKRLLAAWLASPEHKQNILNPLYHDIGVTVHTVTVGEQRYTLIVQLFGTPKTLSVK